MASRDGGDEARRQLTVVLLALFLLLVQFPVVVTTLTHGGPQAFDYQFPLFPSDIVLVPLIVLAAPDIVRRIRARTLPAGTAIVLAIVAVMVVAFIVHPSVRGVGTLLRLAGVAAAASVLATAVAYVERRVILGAFAVWAVLQCGLALAQRASGHNLGLGSLGEFPSPFYAFGSVKAPQGTMVHPYLLAGLAVLAGGVLTWMYVTDRHRLWVIAAAVAVVPVAFTYSRAAAVSCAVLLVGVAVDAFVEHDRKRWLALAALTAGVVIPLAFSTAGWTRRAQDSTTGASVDTGRTQLIHQSLHLLREYPLLGVGPGRYVIVLRAEHTNPRLSGGVLKPVHNVPLLAATEGGVVAGVLMVLLYVVLGWRAWRTGPLAFTVFALYVPITMLDHFAYTFPQGLAMTAVWIGVLDLAGDRSSVTRPLSVRA
jgi:O-antigen ligase